MKQENICPRKYLAYTLYAHTLCLISSLPDRRTSWSWDGGNRPSAWILPVLNGSQFIAQMWLSSLGRSSRSETTGHQAGWFSRLWCLLPNCYPERAPLFPLTLALHGVLHSPHSSTGSLITTFPYANQIGEKSHPIVMFISICWLASWVNVFLCVYCSFVFFPVCKAFCPFN